MSDKNRNSILLRNQNFVSEEVFDELVDLLYDDETATSLDHGNRDNSQGNYVVLNFLEKELARLSAIDNFFSKKCTMELQHGIRSRLIEKEEEELDEIKKDVIEQLKDKNSPYNKELKSIWDQAFSHFKK